jgi:VanZ family protein
MTIARRFAVPALRWGPAIGLMALIFVLSAQPGLRASDDPSVDLPLRHAAHVAVYAGLAAALVRALAWWQASPVSSRVLLLAVALATLYGVSDEVHQSFVQDRTGQLVDVGWDFLGACIGAIAARLVPGSVLRWPAAAQRGRGRTNAGPQAS